MMRYLMDVAGAGLVLIPLLFFMVVCGLLEGMVIYLFRIRRYPVAIGHALVVNIVSLLAGYLLWPLISRIGLDLGSKRLQLPTLAFLWLLTVLIEAPVLKLLNRAQAWERVFMASIVMNFLSYLIFYFMMTYRG